MSAETVSREARIWHGTGLAADSPAAAAGAAWSQAYNSAQAHPYFDTPGATSPSTPTSPTSPAPAPAPTPTAAAATPHSRKWALLPKVFKSKTREAATSTAPPPAAQPASPHGGGGGSSIASLEAGASSGGSMATVGPGRWQKRRQGSVSDEVVGAALGEDALALAAVVPANLAHLKHLEPPPPVHPFGYRGDNDDDNTADSCIGGYAETSDEKEPDDIGLERQSRATEYERLTTEHAGSWDLVHDIEVTSPDCLKIAHSIACLRDTSTNSIHIYDSSVLIKWSSEHGTHIYSRKTLTRHQKERIQWKAKAFALFPHVSFKEANKPEFCAEALRAWALCSASSHDGADARCRCGPARYFLEIGNLHELGFMSHGLSVEQANQIVVYFGSRAWLCRSSASSASCKIPKATVFTITRLRSRGTPCSHRIMKIQGYGYVLLDPGCSSQLAKISTVDEAMTLGLFLKYAPSFLDICYSVLGKGITAAQLLSAKQTTEFLQGRPGLTAESGLAVVASESSAHAAASARKQSRSASTGGSKAADPQPAAVPGREDNCEVEQNYPHTQPRGAEEADGKAAPMPALSGAGSHAAIYESTLPPPATWAPPAKSHAALPAAAVAPPALAAPPSAGLTNTTGQIIAALLAMILAVMFALLLR